jgi:hypothetical protein
MPTARPGTRAIGIRVQYLQLLQDLEHDVRRQALHVRHDRAPPARVLPARALPAMWVYRCSGAAPSRVARGGLGSRAGRDAMSFTSCAEMRAGCALRKCRARFRGSVRALRAAIESTKGALSRTQYSRALRSRAALRTVGRPAACARQGRWRGGRRLRINSAWHRLARSTACRSGQSGHRLPGLPACFSLTSR